jgi:hypothetical protein
MYFNNHFFTFSCRFRVYYLQFYKNEDYFVWCFLAVGVARFIGLYFPAHERQQ